MTTETKIGVLTMALLEDAYNKTAHMRPAATEAARRSQRRWVSTAVSCIPVSSRTRTRPRRLLASSTPKASTSLSRLNSPIQRGSCRLVASWTRPLRCSFGTRRRSAGSRRRMASTSSCSTPEWPACPS